MEIEKLGEKIEKKFTGRQWVYYHGKVGTINGVCEQMWTSVK